jgi:hypothetical protein
VNRIDNVIVQAIIHSGGSCAGCHEGSCLAGYHCPCEGCSCPASTTGSDQ